MLGMRRPRWNILHGDCREKLAEMPAGEVLSLHLERTFSPVNHRTVDANFVEFSNLRPQSLTPADKGDWSGTAALFSAVLPFQFGEPLYELSRNPGHLLAAVIVGKRKQRPVANGLGYYLSPTVRQQFGCLGRGDEFHPPPVREPPLEPIGPLQVYRFSRFREFKDAFGLPPLDSQKREDGYAKSDGAPVRSLEAKQRLAVLVVGLALPETTPGNLLEQLGDLWRDLFEMGSLVVGGVPVPFPFAASVGALFDRQASVRIDAPGEVGGECRI